MAGIAFHKLNCCGNDFVVATDITDLKRPASDTTAESLARKACDRRFGIGADGLFLISGKRVRHLDPDGSDSFCANGSICLSLLRGQLPEIPNQFDLCGVHVTLLPEAENPAARFRPAICQVEDLVIDGIQARQVGIGNPHLFIPVNNPDPDLWRDRARRLRNHPRFPEGVNVSFWHAASDHVNIITYERGVEDFTPCCGSACAAFVTGWNRSGQTSFLPLSRIPLTVDRDITSGQLTLSGKAWHVFQGLYPVD